MRLKDEFSEFTPKGQEFIKLWNAQYRRGAYKTIAQHFNISIASVYRIGQLLDLELLEDWEKHPGRNAFYKRVKKLYRESKSTNYVGKIVGMTGDNIVKILRKQGVLVELEYDKNVLVVPPKNGMSPNKFNAEVKRLARDEGMTNKQIADALNVDHSTVSKRLQAMNVRRTQNHQLVPGGYPCDWCNKIMTEVWCKSGPVKQRYCCSKCATRAKEYRRYKRAHERIAALEAQLKENWGNKWKEAADNIMIAQNKGRRGLEN